MLFHARMEKYSTSTVLGESFTTRMMESSPAGRPRGAGGEKRSTFPFGKRNDSAVIAEVRILTICSSDLSQGVIAG